MDDGRWMMEDGRGKKEEGRRKMSKISDKVIDYICR
jgi:hypothetical protein